MNIIDIVIYKEDYCNDLRRLYTKLISAIKLYIKYGFREIPLINNKYIESDLKMEIDL